MSDKDINNINNNTDIALFTYNNGLDKITESDIYGALRISALNMGYDDLNQLENDCTSAKFNVLLKGVGTMFKASKALVMVNNRNSGDYIFNNPNCSWEYDKNKLYILINIYSDICFRYNKMCSISGFLNFCGIDINYFNKGNNTPELSDNLRARIAEKLKLQDSELQKANARDSKQAVLNLAYNNYVHGWSGEIKRTEVSSVVKSLDDIKRERLEMSANDTQL